jgi:hypothetical protein
MGASQEFEAQLYVIDRADGDRNPEGERLLSNADLGMTVITFRSPPSVSHNHP